MHVGLALGTWVRDHGGVRLGAAFADDEEPGDRVPGQAGGLDAVGMPQITETDLVASAPRVRALMVARLEALWAPVNARLQLDGGGEQPIDPRLLEIGLRIVKEEALIYRLGRVPSTVEEEDGDPAPGVDRAAMIDAKLQEIENKMRDQGSA